MSALASWIRVQIVQKQDWIRSLGPSCFAREGVEKVKSTTDRFGALQAAVTRLINGTIDGVVRARKRPYEVRCTECEGTGTESKNGVSAFPYLERDHCMQCVGTGLTPICSSELMKAGRTA